MKHDPHDYGQRDISELGGEGTNIGRYVARERTEREQGIWSDLQRTHIDRNDFYAYQSVFRTLARHIADIEDVLESPEFERIPLMEYTSKHDLRRATRASAGIDIPVNLPAPVIMVSDNAWTTDVEKPIDSSGHTRIREWRTEPIPTGVRVAIPRYHVGLLVLRSSMRKRGLEMGVGIIDSDYRGELKLLPWAAHRDGIFIQNGERVAQLIVMPYAPVSLLRLADEEFSLDTERGEGGYGSSGS